MTVQRFRKKPVEIEAVQFVHNVDEILAFTGPACFKVLNREEREKMWMEAEVWDKLHGTWVALGYGHWIIRGIRGEFYPCEPSVFEATYDVV